MKATTHTLTSSNAVELMPLLTAILLTALVACIQSADAALAVPNATMTVFDSTAPVITLQGEATVSVELGSAYTDAGATAQDTFDGDLTEQIATTNPVNTDIAGTYTVTYTVSDTARNEAEKTRSVEVVDSRDEFLVTSPVSGSVLYVSAAQPSVPLTMTAKAEVELEFVEYTLDGVPFGMAAEAPFAATTDMDLAAFGWGEHQLVATASVLGTQETLTAQSTFALAPIAAEDDTDGNGIPDNPFLTLTAAGDAWLDAVTVMRFEHDADAPLVVVLDNVTVTVPRALVNENETGIAMVAVSETLAALFGATEAALFDAAPAEYALVSGGRYVQVNVIKSADNGATYDDVAPALLAANPVRVEMRGLSFAGETTKALFAHPTYVDSDPGTGLRVVAAEGGWNAERSTVGTDSMTAELASSSSVLAPYEANGGESVGIIGDVNSDGVIERFDVTLTHYIVSWGEARVNDYLSARGMNPVRTALADVDLDGQVNDWDATVLYYTLRLGKDAINDYLASRGLPLSHVGETLNQ